MICFIGLWVIAAPANRALSSITVYDSLGSGGLLGSFVAFGNPSFASAWAMMFVSTSDEPIILQQYEVGVSAVPGADEHAFSLNLYSDNSGQPGSRLDRVVVNQDLPTTQNPDWQVQSIIAAPSDASVIIQPDTPYWLALGGESLDGGSSQIRWHGNALGVSSAYIDARRPSGHTDYTWLSDTASFGWSAAFRISGEVVPEPSSLPLLLVGLSIIFSHLRPRNTGHKRLTFQKKHLM